MYQKEKTERAKAKFGSVLSHLTRRLGRVVPASRTCRWLQIARVPGNAAGRR